MNAMEQTEQLTQDYRRHYDVLAERVQDLEDEVEKLKRRRLPGIKSAVHQAAEARDQLASHIERHPDLFESPRTVVIAGIRVGMMKGKGKVVVADKAKTCERIRKLFPDSVDDMIKLTESPILSQLNKLPAATLRRLGADVEQTGDQVVIKPVDGDIDKLVNALLKEAETLEEAA